MYGDLIRQISERHNLPASVWAIDGVPPFASLPPQKQASTHFIKPNQLYQYDLARVRLLPQWHPSVIVLAARWSLVGDECIPFFDFACQNADNVLLIEQPPEMSFGRHSAIQYLWFKNYRPLPGLTQYYEMDNLENYQHGRALLRTLAARHPNCHILPTFDLFNFQAGVRAIDGRQVLYLDGDHLTAYGANLLLDRLDQSIHAILKPPAN